MRKEIGDHEKENWQPLILQALDPSEKNRNELGRRLSCQYVPLRGIGPHMEG